ncbi:hypothetical protein LSH36_576g03049 [Paralvinella palmiformis]|uniref:Uncharacterized protein n=1 Tax=Paralvinella palmiformis TaxID=53620 RepID=A0AAD9J5T9_9ANNE|nr:hypothetical protein LSH36_576g03049 [Paralvinella palmiformis]
MSHKHARNVQISMKAYKSLDTYRFAVCSHVQEVRYMDITSTFFCLIKSKATHYMRIRDEPWVYLIKETADVYCAHCMAGLGEVCSDIAVLLFKVEIAVKTGLT